MNQNQNAVFSILMMRFKLDPYTAIPVTKEWFKKHPNKNWQDLKEYLIDGEVVFKNNQLHDLDEIELKILIQKMRGANGLKIKDRWFHFKLYRKCFTGTEAVKWLMNHKNITQEEAIQLGKILVKKKIIHHVHDEHNFKNGFLFFRFYEDEMAVESSKAVMDAFEEEENLFSKYFN